MASTKLLLVPYEKPYEQLLARILTQAVEDVERLPNLKSDYEFTQMRNDLWSFFNSDWFFEILYQLDIEPDRPIWDELRLQIWNCTTHRTYIRPDRQKTEKK